MRAPDPGSAPHVPRGSEKQLQDEVRRGSTGHVGQLRQCNCVFGAFALLLAHGSCSWLCHACSQGAGTALP